MATIKELSIMDYQAAFNIALGIAAFLGGWTLNNVSKAIERLDRDVRNMPMNYLAKHDYQADIIRIETMLNRILDKLDGKQDKSA